MCAFPACPVISPISGKGGRNFRIDEVSENKIVLSVVCADPKYNKTWTIKKGEEITKRLNEKYKPILLARRAQKDANK